MSSSDVVTGCAGLIGYEIARGLLEEGRRVFGVDEFRKGGQSDVGELSRRFPEAFVFRSGDLSAGLPKEMPSEVSRVFHLAATVGVDYVNRNPYETLTNNCSSTLRMIDWAIRAEASAFVFASSSENYASGADAGTVPIPTPEEVPIGISDPRLPRWSYAASKILGESAVFAGATRGRYKPVVIRFHNVYGERMGPTHVIPELFARVRAQVDPFPVYGADQTRSFLHVSDAARGVILASEAPDGGIFNVGSDEEIVIEALARTIFEVAGFSPTVDYRSAPPGSVRRRVPDIGRMRGLGFRPTVPLREGLERCWRVR